MEGILVPNKWESEFFKRPIFNIEPREVKKLTESDFSELAQSSLVCCKVKPSNYEEYNSLANLRFFLAEGEVLFSKKLSLTQPLEKQSIGIFASTSELPGLLLKVKGLYTFSRFREPWFSVSQKDQFYQKWLENAVLGIFDDCCLLVIIRGEIAGFVTLRLHSSSVSIGLIGVLPAFQGQGVGRQLLQLAEAYALENGKAEVTVVTQIANSPALKLYSANNYMISNTAYWFYKQV